MKARIERIERGLQVVSSLSAFGTSEREVDDFFIGIQELLHLESAKRPRRPKRQVKIFEKTNL